MSRSTRRSPDPDGPPPPGEDELTAEEIAEIREATEAAARAAVNGARSGTTGALAAIAALGGRRSPRRDGQEAERGDQFGVAECGNAQDSPRRSQAAIPFLAAVGLHGWAKRPP